MKIKTVSQLQDFLDSEFSWRLKEIADLKLAVKKTGGLSKWTVIRAAVPLLYAHWEGFVKNTATNYLMFVNSQGLRYDELKSCFIVLGLKKQLTEVIVSNKSELTVAAVDFILAGMKTKANLKITAAINTESNLSSKVFENIATSIGLDVTFYKSKYHLIDESLLKRRNGIAHGEYLHVNPEDYRKLADEVLNLLRQFKTDLQNSAANSGFARK